MKKQSLFVKLFIGALGLVVIVCLVNSLIAFHFLDHQYIRNGLNYQTRVLQLARDYFTDIELSDKDLQQKVEQLFPDPAQRLTVIANDGKVLADSKANPLEMANHKTPSRPEIISALNGIDGQDIRKSDTLGVNFRYMAKPLIKNNKVAACVRIAMPVGTLIEGKREIRHILLVAGICAILLAAVAAGWLSWEWQMPMKTVAQAARKIAAGDFSQKVSVKGSREILDLGEALNEMRSSLSAQIKTISSQNTQMRTIVESLNDSVIAVDENNVIIQANPAAVHLFGGGKGDMVGKTIQGVILNADLLDLYEQARTNDAPAARHIEIHTAGATHVMEAGITPINSASEKLSMLIVLHDVTRQAQLSKMKANFVANASHDLRTPIATLKAAVDSLTEGIPDQQTYNRIVDILTRHVSRLEHLVDDLLDLHVIESQDFLTDTKPMNFAKIEKWITQHFHEIASEKGVTLELIIDDPDKEFTCSEILVHSILQNLIENSLKFTPSGGRVEVELNHEPNAWNIRVTDTGCGIAPEHLDKVFERFYQVDSSRTGDSKLRGTGLGLAIVKHAAEKLGTSAHLSSQPGLGTTVTIKMPKA